MTLLVSKSDFMAAPPHLRLTAIQGALVQHWQNGATDEQRQRYGRFVFNMDRFAFKRLEQLNPTEADWEEGYALLQEALRSCIFIGKHIRPWDFVRPSEVNDPNQIWVGFEVETGFQTSNQRAAALEALQKTKRHTVCLDSEGEGAAVEITFMPRNLSDLDKSGPGYLLNMYEKNPSWVYDKGGAYVGTHLNFSTPSMRGTVTRRISAGEALRGVGDAIAHGLTADQRLAIFGRSSVYGPQPYTHPTPHVECKWFRTTYQRPRWNAYKHVSKRFVERVEEMMTTGVHGNTPLWAEWFIPLADECLKIMDHGSTAMTAKTAAKIAVKAA